MNACILFLCLSFGPGRAPEPDRFFAEDKLKHFFTSFIVTSLAASGARAAGLDDREALYAGAAAGAAVGLAKELADMGKESETASVLDLVWDLGGVGAATVVGAQAR